jgi:hypothetical protein
MLGSFRRAFETVDWLTPAASPSVRMVSPLCTVFFSPTNRYSLRPDCGTRKNAKGGTKSRSPARFHTINQPKIQIMKSRKLKPTLPTLFFMLAAHFSLGAVVVDDFEGYATGTLNTGDGGWTVETQPNRSAAVVNSGLSYTI